MVSPEKFTRIARLKMVTKIKEQAQLLKEHKDKNFDTNVRVFDKRAKREVEHIFRDTKYDDRKRERLDRWKQKKYTNRKNL